ncbi:MAG: OmpA family protein [Bryobacterales bacterium]|nr:OmpA family protein [Bryobacterales bacterium]
MQPTRLSCLLLAGSLSVTAWAQNPNPTLAQPANAQQQPSEMPFFRVDVVARSIKAINFHHRRGSTEVGLLGTALAPRSKGEARVDSRTGATQVEIRIDRMQPAGDIGDEFLTYVAWAITPEGRPQNLGELMLDGDGTKLKAATELQSFGLIITAEPYYAVTQPSDAVVMEGVVKQGTTGTITPIEAKYELMPRGMYVSRLPAEQRVKWSVEGKRSIPLDLLEARQAMAVAKSVDAERYAADTMRKASTDLYNAESFLKSKGDTKKIQSLARNVTQLAEDARLIAVKRQEEEYLETQRKEAADRLAAAQTAAEQEARRRELAEAERKIAEERAETSRLRAEREERERQRAERERAEIAVARAEADAARAQAEAALKEAEARKAEALAAAEVARREQAAAEAARKAAIEEQARLRGQADDAMARASKAEEERVRMRQQLMAQLNTVLQTRESARGLIVNMPDVLFEFGKFALRPEAREKLAKVSGIVLAYPALKLEVEGHTDSIGSDAFNQTLSEKRAETVRTYFVSQGLASDTIVARGYGESRPAADNTNNAGRQANRRVEIVVSGAAIQAPGVETSSVTQ